MRFQLMLLKVFELQLELIKSWIINLACFWHCLPSQPTVQYGGELILGGVDTQLFSGQISWAPVTREVYWQIGIEE